MHSLKSPLSTIMKVDSMAALVSQDISKALRIGKENFGSSNRRRIRGQTAPSSIVTANNRIVVSRAQEHRAGVRRDRIDSDTPWLSERNGTFRLEIEGRDNRVVVPGVVEGMSAARLVGHGKIGLGQMAEAARHDGEGRLVFEVVLQDDVATQIVRVAREDEAGHVGRMVLSQPGACQGAKGVSDEHDLGVPLVSYCPGVQLADDGVDGLAFKGGLDDFGGIRMG